MTVLSREQRWTRRSRRGRYGRFDVLGADLVLRGSERLGLGQRSAVFLDGPAGAAVTHGRLEARVTERVFDAVDVVAVLEQREPETPGAPSSAFDRWFRDLSRARQTGPRVPRT